MRGRADLRVAAVIPAYQAVAAVAAVAAGARRTLPTARVYVVDDGSTDGTAAAAATVGAIVLRHATNLGKGAALATGVARALADGASVIVTLDADGQHPPQEIPRLIAPITAGEGDLVLGARRRTLGVMPFGRRGTNWLSARLASRLAGRLVPDAQTGFRAFAAPLAERVQPRERRYDYETAFLLMALEAGYRVISVPVPTIYDGAGSHFGHVVDTWRLARVFARYGWRILRGPAGRGGRGAPG